MLSRKFLAFLLLVKMVTSQSVYPTTAVSYSTNSVPTVQTYPASSVSTPTVVSAMPATVTATAVPPSAMPAKVTATAVPTSAMPATVTATAVPTSARPATMTATAVPTSALPTTMPATCVAATPMPLSSVSSSSPTVTVTASPISPVPKVVGSPMTSETSEPKAYFLPANIPDPKVTILSNDKPGIVEVKPKLYEDTYVDIKPTLCTDLLPSKLRKDVGPMTPVKRMTMACTDDVPTFLNGHPVCPGISKMELTPSPVLKKEGSLKNPIDFEGLLDSFMTCL